MNKEIYLELKDNEWPFDYVNHNRIIVRAIVLDNDGYFYFIRAKRDDIFGKATMIETSGGGVEEVENVLHVHDYLEKDNFKIRPPHLITKEEYKKYKKYFKGVPKHEKW